VTPDPRSEAQSAHGLLGTGFARPRAFWLGIAGIIGGVLLHMPMFFGAADDGYRLSGMPWDRWMIIGMVLGVAGYGAVLYGLALRRRKHDRASAELEFKALDDAGFSRAHVKLLVALTVAIAVDTQKPFTFTFILGGVASEYNLDSPSRAAPGELTQNLARACAHVQQALVGGGIEQLHGGTHRGALEPELAVVVRARPLPSRWWDAADHRRSSARRVASTGRAIARRRGLE